MTNFIIIVILLGIVSGIVFYLYRAKKRGETCIGCPYAKQCGGSGGEHHGNQCGGTGEKANSGKLD